MNKTFKEGDRVFHKNLQMYGTFLRYACESNDECDVDFETEDGVEQRHVSLNQLIPEYIDTNIGPIPAMEYLDIRAMNFGFDSYEELLQAGYLIE